MIPDIEITGLGPGPKDDWPTIKSSQLELKPIDRLKPNSLFHSSVLSYLVSRLETSERAMSTFYYRWRANERRVQAYIDLPNWEKILKDQNDRGKPPQVTSITVPYSFATISTITTYLLQTFCGRKPIFQISSSKRETARKAQYMETVLQYQADHTRIVAQLHQFFQDCSHYGLGIMRTNWVEEKRRRTVKRSTPKLDFFQQITGYNTTVAREMRTVYEGNTVLSQDPFMFFPDPKVPMNQVNKRGEYVFWRDYMGKHTLKGMEKDGLVKWVDWVSQRLPSNAIGAADNQSARDLISRGEATPAYWRDEHHGTSYYQIDQGSVEIIPAELGLGTSEYPEKWMFIIANKNQILMAEPQENDHGQHPVCVAEPLSLGYGFGQPGMADYLGPIQDVISWFLNSHIDNVRKALNDMLIVDPSMVEMQDLKNPEPGKLIRLKKAAHGMDVRMAVNQLNIVDVTASHVNDAQLFMKIGERLSAISENLIGIQDSGGRKTATEVRTTTEAGSSRLVSMARVISAQALVDMTEQMSLNTQQYMSEEFYLQVVGQDGAKEPTDITPEMLVGDFNYPVHDGTLPIDRVALLDVWKELFLGIAQDEQLRTEYSLPKIFEFIAELGGVRNLQSFKLNVVPDAQLEAQAQAGNVVPLPQPGRGKTPGRGGAPPNPGARLAGAGGGSPQV